MNIVLNILNKKQNLSYSLVFRKIAKYYWNTYEIEKNYNTDNAVKLVIENNYTRFFPYLSTISIVLCIVEQKCSLSRNIIEFMNRKNLIGKHIFPLIYKNFIKNDNPEIFLIDFSNLTYVSKDKEFKIYVGYLKIREIFDTAIKHNSVKIIDYMLKKLETN